jgi:F0F1-type ATP synthase membrane subunit b/b'
MSGSINIYPFTDTAGAVRFGIQAVIFLIGLYAAHKLIIKPAIRLQEERKKRTVGNNIAAQQDLEKAHTLEQEYSARFKAGIEEVRKLRAQENAAAQQLALSIVSDSQGKSNDYIKNVRDQLAKETVEAKAKLLPLLDEVVSSVYKKLGLLTTVIIGCVGLFAISQKVYAAEDSLVPSFWYSIFWPYFQFIVFLIAAIYFARKPLKSLLVKRRDDFRAKLSEAQEAIYLANKKVKEYESKVSSLAAELNALKERNLEEARLEKDRIITEANKASALILKDAERTAAELINSSKEEIKKELFSLAILEVEKRLTPEKLAILDQKFKQEALNNIKNIH